MAVTASALALPAEESFTTEPTLEPTTCELSGEPGDLRRVPVPLCDPPFEDETTEAVDTATTAAATTAAATNGSRTRVGNGTGDGAQETLALAFALPSGLPVSPDEPTGLSRGSHRRLQLVPPPESKPARRSAKRKRTPQDDFGPRRTPRASLPEPKPWAGRLVQAIVEVTSGVRPVSQLVRWTTSDVYATMQRRIAHTELLSQRTAGGRRVGAIVRSIHVDEPSDGVAEVCAVAQHGARCRAIALRLEGFDGRWQCTALQVG
jgi:hypothetical protein